MSSLVSVINAIVSNSSDATCGKHCRYMQSLKCTASNLNFRVIIGKFCPSLNELCTSHFELLVAACCICIIILNFNIYYYKHQKYIQPLKTASFNLNFRVSSVQFVIFLKLSGNHFEFVGGHFDFSLVRQLSKFQI